VETIYPNMKTTKTILAGIVAALLAPMTQAEEVIRERITTSSGVVSSFDPESFVITTETEPLRYRFTKRTEYFDEAGNPVRVEVIRKGTPVTVQYVRRGDALEASRVTVRTAPAVVADPVAAAELRTAGTISEFGDATIAVRTEGAAAPVQYHYSKTTKWVDEDGNVVTRETVKSGVPVTVYHTRSGDRAPVSKVVVHKRGLRPTVIEEKTTTTTTTIKEKKEDDDD
jgi:hypothetical protein